jgi:hypothetical protein
MKVATQITLEKIEGELVNKYPPSDAGSSKKMDFYVQPVDSERVRIAVWETDQIAYAVAQAMTEGDQVTVKFSKNPNKNDTTGKNPFYLNAKDIVITSAHTSGQESGRPPVQQEASAPNTTTTAQKKSYAETTQDSIQRQVGGKEATTGMCRAPFVSVEDDLANWDKYFFHFEARLFGDRTPLEPTDIEVDEV